MKRIRIKFCGIRNVDDAVAAAELGVDAIGMIFHPPAKRNISLETAREIMAAIPPFVTPVGLFVDRSAEEILETARSLGLRNIQLHGNEPIDVAVALADRIVIKAVKVRPASLERDLAPWKVAYLQGSIPNLRGIVLETGSAETGGSGQENDWLAIADAKARGLFKGLPPIIAAGGLRPDNVSYVIRTITPWAVDVSSGIEVDIGKKSVEKMRQFVAAVES